MGRIVVLVLLWLIQAVFVVVLVNAEWIQNQLSRERELVKVYLGQGVEGILSDSTEQTYDGWFVRTGAVKACYEKLLPDPAIPKHGMENLAPWWFKWLEERLDAFWWVIYQSLYRSQLILHWLPLIALFVACALIEGLAQRALKRSTFAYASADKHVFAKRGLVLLAMSPLMYFVLPFYVHPSVVPIWGAAVVFATTVLIANAQHHV
jgi:hypothetical protein